MGAFKPYEKQFIRKDGHRIDVLLGAITEEASLEEEAVAFVIDITAKKQYEQALREGEERFDTFVRLPIQAPVSDLPWYKKS